MAKRYGRVGVCKQHCHRLTHYVGAPYNHGILAGKRYALAFKHLHHAVGRAGDKAGLVHAQPADVLCRKTVYILCIGDEFEYLFAV